MLLRLLIIHAIASAVARVHTYWQKQDGLPKDAPRQDDSDLRKMYAPNSPKWRQLPKSFVLEPSSCTAVSGSAVAAYSARYNFGWTKAEATTLTAHQKTQMAIRSFSPQHYYQDPLHRASGSGIGSDLGQMTSEDRAWLISIIKEHNVTTMIDVPCGDVNWQLGAWETDSLTAYIGLDIVPRVVEVDNARFAHHSNKRFADWDFASCSLPRIVWPDQPDPRPADLVHARHVLQHMPIARAAEAAYHLVASGARVVVVTGDYSKSTSGARRGHQLKMREGEMGEKNMAVAPFFFPPPVACNSNRMCAYAFDAASRAMWMARYEKNHRREANASTFR